MTTKIDQLEFINIEDFRIQTIGGTSYLNLIPPDKGTAPSGAVKFTGDKYVFKVWLKMWNIDELEEIESTGMQIVTRKLSTLEKEAFELYRAKMLRCKSYGQNYYENKLMDEI